MEIKLVYKNKTFTEPDNISEEEIDANAILTINEEEKKATLTFLDANLIEKRTARRQAQSILKTGFLMKDGRRVGRDCQLIDLEEDKIDDRLLQEGHKYQWD